MQPQSPVPQPPQAPPSYDFTQGAQPQAAPIAPVAVPDPTITQLHSDISEIKTALGGLTAQPAAPVAPPETPEGPKQKYDEWGAVFTDVEKLVDTKLEQQQQQNLQIQSQVQQQEQQNQQYIEGTVNQLRTAGYLPPVNNQFDNNDPGKQAENELIGYTLALGSTDLVRAAQELKFRHDTGFKYDYQSKQFVQVNQPQANDPNSMMFGNLPATPDGQAPNQFQPAPQMPPQSPVGPRNPYMQPAPQYPAGFNAPVSSGNSYQGTQNGVPALRNIRANSYDALVEQFNRSQ